MSSDEDSNIRDKKKDNEKKSSGSVEESQRSESLELGTDQAKQKEKQEKEEGKTGLTEAIGNMVIDPERDKQKEKEEGKKGLAEPLKNLGLDSEQVKQKEKEQAKRGIADKIKRIDDLVSNIGQGKQNKKEEEKNTEEEKEKEKKELNNSEKRSVKRKVPENEHTDVKCDKCHRMPIIGSRFQCMICDDFDLCEKCKKKGIHDHHAFCEFKTRAQAEEFESKYLKKYHNSDHEEAKEVEEKKEMALIVSGNKIQTIRLQRPFIGDLAPMWKVQNKSKRAWPSHCYLAKSGGNIEFSDMLIGKKLLPNQEIELIVPIETPQETGTYNLSICLKDNNGVRFGETLKVILEVVDSPEDDCSQTEMINRAGQMLHKGYGDLELIIEH